MKPRGRFTLLLTLALLVLPRGLVAQTPQDLMRWTAGRIAPEVPFSPSPNNNATNIPLTPALSWLGIGATDGYDVYFGTSSSPPKVGVVSAPPFSPAGPLQPGTTYYWKVTGKNHGTTGSGTVTNRTAPGSVWHFTTATTTPPPPPPGGLYTVATTTRDVKVKPPLPALGSAGSSFTDPTFGSKIIRVTDRNTDNNQGLHVASNSHISEWNNDGTKFYATNTGGGTVLFSFVNGQVSKLSTTVATYIEPAFSYVDPNVLYGGGGSNSRTILKFNVATGTSTTVLDLDAAYPNVAHVGYIGGLLVTDNDTWVTFFGGESQDQHIFVHHSTAGFFDVRPYGFKIHSVSIDRTGRYVNIYPTSADLQNHVAQVQVWDTQTGTLTPVTKLPGGHDSLGYGDWINQDCCTTTTWDALQWQYRKYNALATTRDLLPQVLLPKEIYLDDHTNWRANKPGQSVPFVASTYRYGEGTNTSLYPWRAWDEEIIAVATDGSGTVWRFAHHRSKYTGDFWTQAIVIVSPDGHWALFTSNMEDTVGAGKQDVFLVELR